MEDVKQKVLEPRSKAKNSRINFDLIIPTKCKELDDSYPLWRNELIQEFLRKQIRNYTINGKSAQSFCINNYVRPIVEYFTYWFKEDEVDDIRLYLEEQSEDRNERLLEYKEYLQTKLKRNTLQKNTKSHKVISEATIVYGILSPIRAFYKYHNAPIQVSFGRVHVKNENEMLIDTNIMKQILKTSINPQRTIILKFLMVTGLRIGDVLDTLTSTDSLGNPLFHFEKYKDYYYLKDFPTQKRKVIINYIFLTKDLANDMMMYYPCQKKDDKKDDKKENDLRNLDCSQIFLARKYDRKGNEEKPIHGTKQIKSTDFIYYIKYQCQRFKIGDNANYKNHCLRKFFCDILMQSGMKKEFQDHVMGHSVGLDTYTQKLKNINFFFEEWQKIEPKLCLDSIIIDNTSKEIEKLKLEKEKEVQIVKTELDAVKQQLAQFQIAIGNSIPSISINSNQNEDFEQSVMNKVEELFSKWKKTQTQT